MPISPGELRDARFARVRKGYDADEVSSVLESAAASLEALQRERRELGERVRQLETELARSREIESTISETLVLAERAAGEMKAEAQAEVDRMLREARAQVAATTPASPTSSLPDPAFIELLGETRAIRSLLQALLHGSAGGAAPQADGTSPFSPRPPS